MRWLQIPSKSIYGTVALDQETAFLERIRAIWHAARGICGIDASQSGPFFFLLMVFFFFLVAVAFADLLRVRSESIESLLWILFAVSIAGTGAAALILSISVRQIYFFLWYPLLSLSALVVLKTAKPIKRRALSFSICILAFLNLFFSYGSSISHAERAEVSPLRQFCVDAENAGYRVIYGEWEAAPRFLVWSDGKLTGGFWEEPTFYIRDHINLTDIYSEEDNASALYLLSPWDLVVYEDTIEDEMQFFGSYGSFVAYSSDRQLMRWPEWWVSAEKDQ